MAGIRGVKYSTMKSMAEIAILPVRRACKWSTIETSRFPFAGNYSGKLISQFSPRKSWLMAANEVDNFSRHFAAISIALNVLSS